MAARQGRGARGASSTRVLYDLADGLPRGRDRPRAVPPRDGAAHPRGARPAATTLAGNASVRGAADAAEGIEPRAAALPAHRAAAALRDRHPRAPRRARRRRPSVVARARERGRRRGSSRSATTIAACASALAIAERHDGVFASLGIHPHDAGAPSGDGSTSSRALLAHRRRSRSARPGSTTSATTRRATRSGALFEAQLELAAELGKPVVIHTRAADEDTLAALAGFDGTVVLHCFSSPALLPTALERG